VRISDWSSDVCSSDLKEVPEIFSDVSRDQPIVKNLDCTALQRLWTTYEPITVRAFDRHVEQPYEPAVLCLMIMAGMHQRHPNPLRRRFEHQRAGIELVDRGRFQLRHPHRPFTRPHAPRYLTGKPERTVWQHVRAI